MASSVWKGHLTFGLVSFPVRLFSAARGETVSFHLLHKPDHSRIKQITYCQAEDKPVPRTDLVKGYEYEKDHYVIVEDEEIKKVAPKTAKVMEILEFVKTTEIDPIYFESSFYMAPDEAGRKPYALLYDTLKRTGYVGVAKLSMHNREHVVILRPGDKGVVLHTMYFSDEIRAVEEFRTDISQVKEKEIALAKMLIESLADDFKPEKYTDTYRENLQKLIQSKLAGHKIVETPTPHIAPVIDIMEALKKSLAQQKKPPRTAVAVAGEEEQEETPADKPRKRRSQGR